LALEKFHGGGDRIIHQNFSGTAASDCAFVGGGLVASANLELQREDTGRAFGELIFVAGSFIEG
jgi:hypothetical protein